jgi:hypothetical protein
VCPTRDSGNLSVTLSLYQIFVLTSPGTLSIFISKALGFKMNRTLYQTDVSFINTYDGKYTLVMISSKAKGNSYYMGKNKLE